jgi:hypothetical protein
MIVGCDPEFEHEFKGKVLGKENDEPLKEVKLEYTFYPLENLHHWRANVMERDSVKFTNEKGQFEINFSTITMTFDSIRIKINKDGYKEKIVVSAREEWSSRLGLNYRKIKFNFGKILLEENKN